MFKKHHRNPQSPNGNWAFGGAATCIGGAIRDPLSGRSYVYQVMRISGRWDTAPIAETRPVNCRNKSSLNGGASAIRHTGTK